VYDGETWPMRSEDVQRLERAEKLMVEWLCELSSLKNRISTSELNERISCVLQVW